MQLCLHVICGVFGSNTTIKFGIMLLMQAEVKHTWRKPMAGRVKCNIDAYFPINSDRVGIDICIRDEHGAFILSKTKWFSPKSDVHTREALGLLFALNWVHGLNLGPVDFELDSKRVVGSSRDFTEFGVIIRAVKWAGPEGQDI
jgi:hypothetical protein